MRRSPRLRRRQADGGTPGSPRPDGGVASRILVARLIAAVPLGVALALGSIRLVFVTYRELTTPLDVATPIAIRVLRGSPEVVVAVVVTWMLAEIVGAVAARRIALADAGVGAGLTHAVRVLVHEPVSSLARFWLPSLVLVIVLVPSALAAASAWEAVGTVLNEGAEPLRLLADRGRVRRSVDRGIGAHRRRVRVAGGRLDGRRGHAGRGRSGGPLTADRVTGGCARSSATLWPGRPQGRPDGEVNDDDDEDTRLRRMRRIGPVRTFVVPVVRCAPGVRDGRSQVRRSGRPGRGRTGEPGRRSRARRERRPADAPAAGTNGCQGGCATQARSGTVPGRSRDAGARPERRCDPGRRSQRRRRRPTAGRSPGPEAGTDDRRGRAARARPGSVRAGPRRGPEPNPELRADASRSGAERRLDPDTDARSRRRGGSHAPPARGQGGADARSVEAATDGSRPEEPAPIPSAMGTAGRTPSYAPTPAAALRARTSAPATPARSQTARSEAERVEAERAAIVPLLEPSAIASLPATPWAPLEEPAPALIARPYQRHLAYELDPVDTGPPPSAYRPPSQAVLMANATAAANEAARAHPAADVSGAGGAEATMTKDSTWWLNTVPDPARFVEIAGWFIVVGAAMSLLGFLLPWSRVVIGARTNGGYFDGWGLASPTHLFVFVGLLTVLALAIRRRPVPAWISSGILGLVFGGLLLGLAWPYLVGPLGADVGLTMITLGGVALLIGGVLALWATRHVEAEPLV